jgi:predicted glycosyltransferase
MHILMYSHDTYGLGHIRRTLALAQSILQEEHTIIIITGSPLVGRFDIPHGIDFVRIPGMIKKNNELYLPHSIKVEPALALAIRRDIILATAQAFRPALFLVDKAPLGLKNEVLPTLRWLHDNLPETKLVLGLRDIMDNPENTINEWQEKKIYAALEKLYSEIWVYGSRDIYDPIKEYAMPQNIAPKVQFTGYIPRQIPLLRNRSRLRRGMGISPGEKFVLVTTGGGGDGYKVLDTFLTMLETKAQQEFKSMIITGPLLAEELYDQLAARAHKLKVRIVKFYRKMEKAILAADCVVSMGGYNTMCEIICAARPSLVVPRSTPREEQLIRARLFAAKGLLEYIPWEEVDALQMQDKLSLLLDNPDRYGEPLSRFPMTAFAVINSRIHAFGEHA